jgi:hypothetical protein
VKRQSNWTPAIVANRVDRAARDKIRETIPEPSLSALNVTYLDNDRSPDGSLKVFDRKSRGDLCFMIGVAVVLALPVLFGTGVYFATTALLGAS